jgi:hypothetical protein
MSYNRDDNDNSYGSSGRGGDDSYGSSGRGGDDSYGSSGRGDDLSSSRRDDKDLYGVSGSSLTRILFH